MLIYKSILITFRFINKMWNMPSFKHILIIYNYVKTQLIHCVIYIYIYIYIYNVCLTRNIDIYICLMNCVTHSIGWKSVCMVYLSFSFDSRHALINFAM